MAFLVLLSAVYLAVSRGQSMDQCRGPTFFTWPGINRGGMVTRSTADAILVSSCQRICLLYTDCVGFNINLTDATAQIGLCSVLSKKHTWINAPQFNPGLTFYEKDYEPKNIALPEVGTTCYASNEANAVRKCDNVMDGDLTMPWVSKILDNNQWIHLKFSDSYEVRRVDIYHRCRFGTQCELIDLIFSDGQTVNITRQCNYYPDDNCTSVPVEMYYVDMIETTSLRIACTKRCIMNDKRIGFDEVLVWN